MNPNPSININGRRIARDAPPYIIAELSANHNGQLEVAKKVIEEAHRAGASAVKIQTYTADTITLNTTQEDFQIREGLWKGRTLYELYEQAHMPWEWHAPLFDYARHLDITLFSSPFDETAVNFLEDLGAPAYKIASFEAIDLPLIKYVAGTHKPMVISTGMATFEEIEEAIEAAYSGGCTELAILHCVSGYPAPAADYNLATLVDMQRRLGVVTGLSDHTLDTSTAIASVALGASIIEKHVTLDRKGGGPDDSFSLEPKELQELCRGTRTAWEAIGTINYNRKTSENDNIKFRRSLYFVKTLKVGDQITRESVRSVRPGFGLPPKTLPELIGKSVKADVSYGTPVKWELIQK